MHFSEEFKTENLRLPSVQNPKSSFFHPWTKSDSFRMIVDNNRTSAGHSFPGKNRSLHGKKQIPTHNPSNFNHYAQNTS